MNAPIRIEVTCTARQWVEGYFYDDGRKCGECSLCNSWTEGHGERMAECGALAGDETLCPALPDGCPDCGNYALERVNAEGGGCTTTVPFCMDCGWHGEPT